MSESGSLVTIIDDDDAVRDSLRLLVESSGRAAQDYASGELFLNSDIAQAGCLLLDLHMPGISGLELLRLLRGRGWGVPVIVISGRRDAMLDAEAREAGASAILSKPFDDELLLDLVEKALQGRALA